MNDETKNFWKHGQQLAIAKRAGISKQRLNAFLARKNSCPPALAKVLEFASSAVLETPIGWEDWVFAKTTSHPAFRGEPQRAVQPFLL